jgi:selenide,water dikinase
MPAHPTLKLTSLSSCAGCAAKLAQPALRKLLGKLNLGRDKRLLVGAETGDDAGIFRLDARRALVQTVDFFPPIVDDPGLYGQIAAANAISDVYAMGGRPITAMNVVGMPDEEVPPEVVAAILKGGAAKAREAKCVIVGGHTIRNPQPIYGMSVTGLVDPKRVLTNAGARPGDLLVLTKPLGTGIVTTAIKRDLAPAASAKAAIASMTRLNAVGADVAELGWVKAATDITGFGLLGHLGSMCRASAVGAVVTASALPILPGVEALIAKDCVPGGTKRNLEAALEWTDFDEGVEEARRLIAADAQTSGGLLMCVPEKRWDALRDLLRKQRTLCAAVIGRIVRAPRGRVRVEP